MQHAKSGRLSDWFARHYVLLLVSTLYSFAALDRSILSLLVDQMRQDLRLSDAAFGTIVGIGFAGPQFLLALPVARWVDRGNRKKVMMIAVAIWSGATALGGLASTATQLLLSRMITGAGESSNSVYHSVLSDVYDKNRRSKAIGVYYAMSALVGLVCFAVGGVLAEHYGWRVTLMAAGLPGLLLIIVVHFTFREPVRGAADAGADVAITPGLAETLRFLAKQRTYVLMVFGNFVLGLGFGALLFWYPAFLARVHGLGPAQVGIYAGLGMGLANLAGYLFGGIAVARLCLRNERWRAGYPALAVLLFAPALLVATWTDSLPVAVTFFCLAFFLQSSMLSGLVALVQSVLMPRMRGTGAAVFNICSGLSALGLAPMWSGLVNDLLASEFGAQSIRYSIMPAIAAAMLAALIFFFATRTSKADLARIGG